MSVYGTVSNHPRSVAFPGSGGSPSWLTEVHQPVASRINNRADLPTRSTYRLRPGFPSPGRATFLRPHIARTHGYWFRNINRIPIDYVFRPRLRGRLTRGGLTLPRNPWVFGGRGSHPSFRYSCRQSLFRYLQSRLPSTFTDLRNAPLPSAQARSRDFGGMLSPVTLSAQARLTSELLRFL